MTVEFNGICVSTSVSERWLLPDRMTSSGLAAGAVFGFVNAVSSGREGTIGVPVDVVELSLAPPLLTATPAGTEVADEPAEVEATIGSDGAVATDVFDGAERFVLSVGELAAGV